ncbi:transcriptional regulator [Asanoa ishikariensis]|uniref:Transcriptional regulator, HxlR family n=1 Tax=Asanoa ishikariensis TaxID=137265 RepID=A0A1H3TBV3_9ACTN|nr:winged helix-turn-helix transcriptional regulator [Asanoa ishikariensis]GIF62708.1 transcriptional regulator [Asanoa ishikariensis]SDZ47752.1 transcriptional regulator, HxlR family [Asanoa ishikariensis]
MSQRSYEDECGTALALDVVGERWALLVVRELVFGPKRFRDLRAGLPKASQNVLSQRLRELEDSGVVRKVELGPPVSASAYELTDRGRALEPVLIELSRWGANAPGGHGPEMSTDAFMLLLKALRRPSPEPPAVRLLVGADAFDVVLAADSVSVTRGAHADVDATVRADVPTLWRLVFTDLTVPTAIAAGDLELTGDRTAAERFFRSFGLSGP